MARDRHMGSAVSGIGSGGVKPDAVTHITPDGFPPLVSKVFPKVGDLPEDSANPDPTMLPDHNERLG